MMGLLCPALSWKLWGLDPSTQLPLTLGKEFFKSNEILPIPSPHCPWLKCPFSWPSYNTCLALLSGQCPACLHLQPTQCSAPVGNCLKSIPPSPSAAHSLSLSHMELRRCPPHSSRQCQLWTEGRNSLGTLVNAMWIPCSSFNHESEHDHGGLAAAQHYRCLKHSPCQGGVEHEIGPGVGVLYSAHKMWLSSICRLQKSPSAQEVWHYPLRWAPQKTSSVIKVWNYSVH